MRGMRVIVSSESQSVENRTAGSVRMRASNRRSCSDSQASGHSPVLRSLANKCQCQCTAVMNILLIRSSNSSTFFTTLLFLVLVLCCFLTTADEPDLLSPALSPMDLLHAVHTAPGQFRPSHHNRSMAPGISLLSERLDEEEEEGEEEEQEEITLSVGHDCLTAKRSAESSRSNNPSVKLYVPSCADDGRYNEIQCYEQFCWCVDIDKGIPMKGSGSSLNSSSPDCSRKKPVSRIRDCHMEQKLHFLKLLTGLFYRQMILIKFKRQAPRRRKSKVAILRWKFDRLDRDNNTVLDRREWKLFKQSLKGSKKRRNKRPVPYNSENFQSVKHCFRFFFRGCDLNSDGIVIENEWLECTGSSINTEDNDPVLASLSGSHFRGRRQHKRKGPNPFATILKAD